MQKKKYGVGGGCVQRANHNHFEGRQSPLDYCRNIYINRWYYHSVIRISYIYMKLKQIGIFKDTYKVYLIV